MSKYLTLNDIATHQKTWFTKMKNLTTTKPKMNTQCKMNMVMTIPQQSYQSYMKLDTSKFQVNKDHLVQKDKLEIEERLVTQDQEAHQDL